MTMLPRVSASKIKTFEVCRTQYVAKYLLKLPQTVTTYSVVGLAVHKAIECAYTRGEYPYDVARDFINNEFSTTFADVSYIGWNAVEAIERAYAHLDTIPYDRYAMREIEREFVIPFPADNPICDFHGFIDFISAENDVIDWKTAKKPPTRKETITQLAIYAYAFHYVYGVSPRRVFLFHTATGKEIEVSPREISEKLAELPQIIGEMLVLDPFQEIARCERCSLFCPLYTQKEYA